MEFTRYDSRPCDNAEAVKALFGEQFIASSVRADREQRPFG